MYCCLMHTWKIYVLVFLVLTIIVSETFVFLRYTSIDLMQKEEKTKLNDIFLCRCSVRLCSSELQWRPEVTTVMR